MQDRFLEEKPEEKQPSGLGVAPAATPCDTTVITETLFELDINHLNMLC